MIAVDGKGRRGIHGEELPRVRVVAAYRREAGRVLAHIGVPTDAHEVQLDLVPTLLAVALQGAIVAGNGLPIQGGLAVGWCCDGRLAQNESACAPG